jgi:tetrahydromethanopterin S-methyltransferase subunit G
MEFQSVKIRLTEENKEQEKIDRIEQAVKFTISEYFFNSSSEVIKA